MATVTVLSGPERRRRWTRAEKLRIVADSFSSGTNVVAFARQHDIHPNLLHAWRRQSQSGALSVAREETERFVPVTVASNVAGAADSSADVMAVEVVLRNGRVLRLSERAVPARVAQLADALEECAP
jgi:transposase-like protein